MRYRPALPYVQNIRGHLYFRRAGFPRVKLPGQLLSPTFMKAYEQAMALTPVPIGASKVERGSVAHAVGNYFTSPQFTELAPGTQAMRRAILNRFRDLNGERPIGTMPPAWLAHVLAELKPHARRNWLKAIRALCQFAVAVELIKADPTAGMKLPKVKSGNRRAWTPEEIAQYEAAHPIGTKARLAFALGLCTLQRRGDIIRMGPQDIRDGMLAVRQEKTGAVLALPIRPELRAVIDATPLTGLSTFLVTKSGKQYSGTDFDEQFRAWCNEAGLPPDCYFHGLRATGCTILADAGCTAHEIAAWSGHITLKEVERYTRGADQKRLAARGLAKVLSTV
jgi:integrase